MSLQNVYALSRLYASYDDAQHSSDDVAFQEFIGVLEIPTVYLINRVIQHAAGAECNHSFKHATRIRIYDKQDNSLQWREYSAVIVNDEQKPLWTANIRTMLSNDPFTISSNDLLRYPTALGSFDWSKIATLDELQ